MIPSALRLIDYLVIRQYFRFIQHTVRLGDLPDHPARNSCRKAARRNIPCHNAACANDAAVLTEDWVNGAVGLRRTPEDCRVVNTAFPEDGSCYVCRSQSGERWWPYNQIVRVVESRDYFALLLDRKHGQVFDKKGFTWGTMEEFRELIRKKTGLKIQYIR